MINISVKLEVKSNRFGELAAKLPALAALAVRKAATDITAFARRIAPVDTGALRNSINWAMAGAAAAIVSVGVAYGIFVEFGTRHMAAQPYFTPAVEWMRPQFEAAIINALKGLA